MSFIVSRYKILKDQNIVIEYYEGVLDIDSFINFKRKLTKDNLFSDSLNYYIDFRNVTFIISEDDVDKYLNFLLNNSDYLGKRKVALITNTPNQVVPTTFFKIKRANSLQMIEVFSTNEAATDWLGIKTLSINEVETVLKKLQHEAQL